MFWFSNTQNVIARLAHLSPARQGNHACLPTTIYSLAARIPFLFIHQSLDQIITRRRINLTQVLVLTHTRFPLLSRIHQEWLLKLLRRSLPPLAVRVRPGRSPQQRRRRLAKRLRHLLERRKSAIRRAKKPILHIFTKV